LANQFLIIAHGGLDVCDGAHRLIVMKNPGGSQSKQDPRLTRM